MCDTGFGCAVDWGAACITYACAAGETAALHLRVGEKNFYAPLLRI
jgi:hypothetical protein